MPLDRHLCLQRRSQWLHFTEPPSLGVSRRGHAHKHAGIGGEERVSGFFRGRCRQKASEVSDVQECFLRFFFFFYTMLQTEGGSSFESHELFGGEVPSRMLPSPRLYRVNNGFKYLPMSAGIFCLEDSDFDFPVKILLDIKLLLLLKHQRKIRNNI